MKDNNLKNGLLYIMNNYLLEKNRDFKQNRLAVFLRGKMTEIINEKLDNINNIFLVKGSAGAGNWAEIPWICIFNKNITVSAQKGIYIVFLFSADMKRVYLSLNQGYTFYRENNALDQIKLYNKYFRDLIKENYNIGNYLNDIDLSAKGELGRGYESCNIISKCYYLNGIQEDKYNIKEDLLELLSIYNYIYFKLPKGDINLFYRKVSELLDGNKVNSVKEDISNLDNIIKDVSPKEMVSHIYNYIDSRGFIFDIEDIANLYLSMKTKPFVLMAGISGTGKSKLVKLFANAIGATAENGRYRLISVKPDWNDGSDLFGYIDINGDYIPGVLTEIIYDANKEENLDKPYIVCLDEMNLARVEYYLSDYLSIIETREKTLSGIKTNKVFPKEYFKKDNKYQDIYFSDNIIIVGTVNMDDTTFAFSEKVLDRANTIEFSKVRLDFLDFPDKEISGKLLGNRNFKSKYLTIKDALIENRGFVEKVNKDIIDIHNILKGYNRHFGYRVRDEIVFYMLENHNNKLLSYNQAFDYQLHQKILPRISGSDYEIKEMLLKLFNHINQTNQLVDTYGYLDNVILDDSKYRKTSEKIIQMLRGYENGYVSFW